MMSLVHARCVGLGQIGLLVLVAWLLVGFAGSAEAAEETAPAEKTIAGQVVDEEGKPVVGIHVYLMGFSVDGQSGYVRTDEQGRFEVPRGSFEDLDERSQSILQAFDDHQSPQLFAEPTWSNKEIEALKNADQLFRELTVVVKRPSTAKVRVVDGQGNPVEGANVRGQVGNNTSLGTVTTGAPLGHVGCLSDSAPPRTRSGAT